MRTPFVICTLFVCVLTHAGLAQSEWTGFYIGGNLGASSDKAAASETVQINQVTNLFVTGRGIVVIPSTTREFAASRRETNWTGGGQAGYQWQSGGFVGGFEGDFNPFRRTTTLAQTFQLPLTLLTPNASAQVQRDARIRGELSLRGRAGAAFGRTLVYGTGGYSWARAEVAVNDSYINPGGPTPACPPPGTCTSQNLGPSGPVVTTGSERFGMHGWNIGGGVERKIGKHFSLGFEYRHTDIGSKTFVFQQLTATNTGPQAVGTSLGAGNPGGVNLGVGETPGATSTGPAPNPTSFSHKSDSFGVRFNIHF